MNLAEQIESYWQEELDPKDPLVQWRQKAWDVFRLIGLPKPKQEAFQYLPLQKLSFPKPASKKTVSLQEIEPHVLPECRASLLVFVDGFFDEALSRIPSPLVALPLDGAMRTYGLFLQNRLLRVLKEETDPFAALNLAFQGRGVFLYAPPKTEIKAPLQILHFFTSAETASPRIQISLGKNARLQIAQTAFHRAQTFANLSVDLALDENAELSFYDAQEVPAASQLFQSFRATLKRNSRAKLCSFTRGSKMVRSSIRVQLCEENAETQLLGLWRLKGENQAHVHAVVEHQAPHTRSRQHFKGVLKEKSRSSFEGKIAVRPEAQKTEAYQLNNNLVLSDEASANAKPNLEIFADDVKASHGATVAQLDEEELFYLRSRGLSLPLANKWLIAGFCRELIDPVPIESLKARLLKDE